MKAYLFYGTQLVDEFNDPHDPKAIPLSKRIKAAHDQEIYDGGWVYAPWYISQPYAWWRCDMTPVLIQHVPKELRALALLIT